MRDFVEMLNFEINILVLDDRTKMNVVQECEWSVM